LLTLQGTDLEPAQFIAYFEKKLVKPLTYQNFPYALAGTARLTDNRAAYLREVVKSRRQTLQYPVKKQLPPKLVIFDDKFPTILSSFRVTEFNHYLRHLNSIIYSFNPNFEQNLQTYIGYYPEYRNRIFPYKRRTYSNLNASLFYIIFLNNAYRFLPEIENTQTPFIFTLYPGGGFELDQPASDLKLNTVIRSRLFRKVIVTQKVTYDYLLSKNLCAPEKIEYIYGGVEPADYFQEHNVPKVFYKKDKATFDICFVAHKYMPKGINKGYHTFISTAKILARLNKDFRFHVVGNYGPDDITIEGLENRVKFYGSQHLSFFPEFYSRMDMILSPNIPFVHAPGNFDGFPTGCCVEAGFAGVAVLHADVLNENQDNTYLPDKELCIINTNPDDIANKVLYYFNNLDQLYALSKAGQSKFYEIYSSKSQLDSRLALLKKYI
jgi:glycosyltransferase involved in cell wall biosynthesis